MLNALFIDIPEIYIINNIQNLLLGQPLKIKKILEMTLINVVLGNILRILIPSSMIVVVIFLIGYLLLCLYIKEDKIKCLIAMVISYAIKFISEFTLLMFLNMSNINVDIILSHKYYRIILIDVTLIITLLIYFIMKKNNINILHFEINKPKLLFENKFMIKVLMALSVINIVIVQAIAVEIISNLENYSLYSRYNFVIIGVIIWIVFCISCLIITILILEKGKDSVQIENNLIRTNLNQMTETVDLLRIQRHDYMNHLQVILMQVSNGKNQDARKYILGISDEVKNNISTFDTGSNYIDAILNFKSAKCCENNIELTACIDSLLEGTPLQDTQLSSIFLNIIDNAIDELIKCEKEYKYVHVDTYIDNEKYIIAIKNNGRKIKDTKKIFAMGYSSKGENRGYGLYSIKQILKNNRCSINVLSDDEETEFIIQLPIVKMHNT